jgi:hypothetical protein
LFATYLAKSEDGRTVRHLEDALTRRLEVPQTMRAAAKLQALVDLRDLSTSRAAHETDIARAAQTGGMRILTGVKRLPALSRRKVGEKPLLPREVDDKLVPAHWRKAVYANTELPQGSVDRDAYVVCVLEQLFRALKRRDIFRRWW